MNNETQEEPMALPEKQTPSCTRRDLLRMCGCGGVALLLLPILSEEVQAQGNAVSGWVSAGKLSHFPIGLPVRVTLPDKRIVFVLQEKGKRWTAVSARCSHEGILIRWQPDAAQFVCPGHGATFAKDGSKPTRPARRSLEVYPVRIQSNQVWIATGTRPNASNATNRGTSKEHGERDEEKEEKDDDK